MKPIAPIGMPVSISSSFWLIMGLLRFITEFFNDIATASKIKEPRKRSQNNLAVIIPSHNEELSIRSCVGALKKSVQAKHIYVVSDGSTDKTVERARQTGCHVMNIVKNKGKAKAMLALLAKFRLLKRYKYIFIVDADTRIDEFFVERAIPMFDDPEIAAVFGAAKIRWIHHWIPRRKYYYIAYRERLNRLLQHFYIFGQTWKHMNTSYVAPGFATIFRSKVLAQLELDTPGLLIEDFHTAFQIHRKKLGIITYHPSLIGWDQHPESLSDYWKQVQRWNIGFFQTIRRDGIWPSFFWLSLGAFTIEVFIHSLYILALPFLILYILTPMIFPHVPQIAEYSLLYQSFGPYQNITLADIIKSFFIIDYCLTALIAIAYKKPQLLFYGLFFFIMHYITALILITSIIPGFFYSSAGNWKSPKRSLEQMSVKI